MTDCKDKCWCKKFKIKISEDEIETMIDCLYVMTNKIDHLYDGIEKCFERIESIEAEPRVTLSYHDSVFKRIEKLEGYMEMEDHVTASDVLLRLCQLENDFDEVCKNFDANRVMIHRKPYRCPVCNGTRYGAPELVTAQGTMTIDGVQKKIGDTMYLMPTCKCCEGKGIVWG